MFKNYLGLLLTLIGVLTVSAQKRNFQEGYIITKDKDTVYGWVKDRSPEPFVSLYNKIRFKEQGRGRTQKLAPDAILGYGYNNQHFIAMPFREESRFFTFRYYSDAAAPTVFLKVVERTPELLYLEQEYVHEDNSYVDFTPFFYRPGRKDLVRVTQGIFGFRKKRLTRYFQDCPAVLDLLNTKNSASTTVWELYDFCVAHCDL